MILHFVATEFGASDDGYALVCGASNSQCRNDHHYITLSRSSDPADKDVLGVHFEIDDQINGGYDLLKSCECSPELLVCHLSKGVQRYPDLSAVEVALPESAKSYEALVQALKRIFRDRRGDLTVTTSA
jgi:hypothetical protein